MYKIKNINKKAITLLELIIAIWILWIWLVSIMQMTNVSIKNIDKIRQDTVATNLAREWVEVVQQIRNTNRLKSFWSKDSCWLKKDPLGDDGNCSDDDWIGTWSYIFFQNLTWWQKYFLMSWSYNSWLDLSYFDEWIDDVFSLCYNSSGLRYHCPWITNPRSEWFFFREIKWIWLYQKDVDIEWWVLLDCKNWSSSSNGISCWSSNAKEYRFCSNVEYFKEKNQKVELCSIITNFEK